MDNQCGEDNQHLRVKPALLARLLQLACEGQINLNTPRRAERNAQHGHEAAEIIAARGFAAVRIVT